MEPILCICISSYNKSNRLEKLVKEILKFQSTKISVVVVDDNSSDDTKMRISKIADKRLQFYQNSSNKGGRENWYESIKHGRGKYILHLLDRDWIQIGYLKTLVDILEHEEAGFGYVGNIFSLAQSKNEVIEYYRAGSEALEKFAFVLVHPSGFFVKRSVWENIHNKEQFFRKKGYGIYPHSYIFAIMSKEYTGMLIHYPLIKMQVSFAKYKSEFYKKNKENVPYWWTPEAHKMELIALTRYAYKYMNLPMETLRKILIFRFNENLKASTIIYRDIAKDRYNAKHYGLESEYIDEKELIIINWKFVFYYIMFLIRECIGILNFKLLIDVLCIGIQNQRDICIWE